MLQCTALRRLPIPETLLRVAEAKGQPEDLVWFAQGFVACELAEGHGGEHADHLWDVDDPDRAVWLLWNDTGYRFVSLRWCAVVPGDDDACELYAEHPSGCSWDVHDPTVDTLTADVAQHPERWGLPPHTQE